MLTRLARLLTIFPVLIIRPGSLLVDFYLKFLSSVPNPVQLLLNVLKTGFIGGIPVDKKPVRLYNATGIHTGGSQTLETRFPWQYSLLVTRYLRI